MEEVTKALQDIGLKTKEIKVYLALIKKGPLSALQISKETGIDRTTAYDILRKLMETGIVSEASIGKTMSFMGVSPENLAGQYKRRFNSLKSILPELNKIAGRPDEPIKCEMFQGKNGLVNVIKDLVMSRSNYKAIGIREEYEEVLGYFHKQFLVKIDLTKTRETAIVEKKAKFKKAKNGVYRYVNERLPPTTTVMYKDTVIFFIWEGPYTAIRIKNKKFEESQEKQFNIMWETAETF